MKYTVELDWEFTSKNDLLSLSTSQLMVLDYFINELRKNPYKTTWKKQYRYHKLECDKYNNLDIYSLSINPDNEPWTGDRFCYSIDDKTNTIILFILSTSGHYKFLRGRSSMAKLLNNIRYFCKTKEQKLAFNLLLSSFRFKNLDN